MALAELPHIAAQWFKLMGYDTMSCPGMRWVLQRQYLTRCSGKVGRNNDTHFVGVKPANPIHTPQRLELMSCQAREQARLE